MPDDATFPDGRPPRICILARKDLTHNTRVARQVWALENAGFAVTVICIRPPHAGLMRQTPQSRYITVTPRVPLAAALRSKLARRPLAAEPAPAALERRPAGARRALVRMITATMPVLVTRNFGRKAARAVERETFDLVQAHDSMALQAAARVAGRSRCPLVYDAVEIPDDRSGEALLHTPAWLLRLESTLDARVIRRCAAVMTVSNGLAEWMVRRYRIAKPSLVRNCRGLVDIKPDDRIRRDCGLRPGERLVLYLNSLYPGQGLEQLVDSIAQLPDAVHVATLGPRPKRDYVAGLLGRAEALGVGGRFHVLEPKPAGEMLQYAAGADIGIVPRQNTSLNNYYSLPNRIFELTMARLPIAAASLPDMKMFVEEYGIGATFDETDPADIARIVVAMLEPSRLETLRGTAAAAASQLSWQREAVRYLEIIAEGLGTGATAAPAMRLGTAIRTMT